MLAIVMLAIVLTAAVVTSLADSYSSIAPWIGVLAPFAVAFLVRYEAEARAKQLVTMAVVAIAAALSLLTADWSDITPSLVLERLTLMAGEAWGVYTVASMAVAKVTRFDSLNEMPVFRPESGIG